MIIIGHRGCKKSEGENTLRNIKIALEAGAHGIEIDLRKFRDRIVILHDKSVDRTTDGKGLLKNLSETEFKLLTCKNGDSIPYLENVLCHLGKNISLFLEIKEIDCHKDIERILSLNKAELLNRKVKVTISSFHSEVLYYFAKSTDWGLAMLFKEDIDTAMDICKKFTISEIHVSLKQLTDRNIRLIKKHNLRIFVYTVNHQCHYQQCKDYGVDGIITDVPDFFLKNGFKR